MAPTLRLPVPLPKRAAQTSRRYHRHPQGPLWEPDIRTCNLCLKTHFVSTQDLYHDYGIDFTLHVEVIMQRVYQSSSIGTRHIS
jgi:hypothetical protein